MKSERRHELQHNELADWIVKTAKAIQPYQNLILAAVVILVVAGAAYTWWSRTTADQAGRAWYDLNAGLRNPEKLVKVVEDHPDSRVGQTAAVVLADLRLFSGCNQRFISKALAEPELSKAAELYEADLKATQSEFLRERATFGLARAKESQGELTAARQHYDDVVKKWPKGTYAAVAQQRLDDLNRLETKQMYDDFAKFDRKPDYGPASTLPGLDMPSGGLPGLPSEPAIEPNTLPDVSPAGGAKGVDEKKPVDNKKSADANKAAEEKKPAEGKKPLGEKKPAESKKPADTKKPAESKKP
jgi:hypothetical protein